MSRPDLLSAFLGAGVCIATAVWPALGDDIAVPTEPAAKAAFDMLERHCSRCHQDGRLVKRAKPAKNFGNVLRLDELARAPHFVVPGNPDGSLLFSQIAKGLMPYDLYQNFDDSVPTPTAAEIQALRSWIEGLGAQTAAACESRKFVGYSDMVALMAADLGKLSDRRARGTRYITLTHLFNACTDAKDLEVYRQGVVKLVNSLSRSSDVVRLATIDPDATIIRINIDDLGWSEQDWNTVLAAYPYGVKPNDRAFGLLQQATGTVLPYVRGDWFAFTAAQPPLYNALLKLPANFHDLQRQQGLDIEANLRKHLAQRAGFQKSGVSQNNRLIERHQIRSGYFWTSYDFAGNRQKQSLFEFPLGPGRALGFDEFGFSHDGGETILSLPNGFQGYFLNNAKGEALDKGPTNIVHDASRRDQAVTNGISCMGCHDQGIRKAKDDVRALVLSNRGFPKPARDAVEELYPAPEQMDRILDDDTQRFVGAMRRAGLDPALKLNGVEMINALAARYEANVDLRLAAAEFGLKPEALKVAAAGVGANALSLLRRLDQALVPRDQFESRFADLVRSLTDDQALDLTGVAGPKEAQVAKVEPGPTAQTRTFDLSLTSDKDAYRQGDQPVFTVVSQEDCHLTLISVDASGRGVIIFPNEFQRDNRIKARTEFRFGDGSAHFAFELADKGSETVVAECNASQPTRRGFEASHRDGGFTNLGNYSERLSERVAAQAAEWQSSKRQIRVKGVQPDIIGRTAIKIDVR